MATNIKMSPSSVQRIKDRYLTVQNIIVEPIATLTSLFLVYGMYIIIFGLSVHVLHRRKVTASGLYMACTVSLFLLASLYVVSETVGLTRQAVVEFRALRTGDYDSLMRYLRAPGDDPAKIAWVAIDGPACTLMNAIADVMLIHRCYILWGSKKIMLYVLGVAAFVINAIGLAGSVADSVGIGTSQKYLYMTGEHIILGWMIATIIFNSLLSLSTAGRIWWISREARQHMGPTVHARYRTIVAVILESGLLYPTFSIAAMVIPLALDPQFHGTIPIHLTAIATLMSGLAPTLIIVRVAYGKSVTDSVQHETTIRFAERNSRQALGTRTVQANADVQTHHRSESSESEDIATPEDKMSKNRMVTAV
ncbi:hypothetical protein PM082_002059 [Marasmius tenuissimus]|nr:hypothetical protein PM082_002059 [Marasmius tenuissimus]